MTTIARRGVRTLRSASRASGGKGRTRKTGTGNKSGAKRSSPKKAGGGSARKKSAGTRGKGTRGKDTRKSTRKKTTSVSKSNTKSTKTSASKQSTSKKASSTGGNPSSKKRSTSKKSPIAKSTIKRLKARLEEERETYVRQAEELAAEAEALMEDREPGDTQFDEESGEGDTINVERERDLALSASALQAVEEIDAALDRIKKGTYGICQRCGNKIPVARLEAVPQAALCIECKAHQERRR